MYCVAWPRFLCIYGVFFNEMENNSIEMKISITYLVDSTIEEFYLDRKGLTFN